MIDIGVICLIYEDSSSELYATVDDRSELSNHLAGVQVKTRVCRCEIKKIVNLEDPTILSQEKRNFTSLRCISGASLLFSCHDILSFYMAWNPCQDQTKQSFYRKFLK